MATAVRASLATARILIMAAAPADFRPHQVHGEKIEKMSAPSNLAMETTQDILMSTAEARREDCIVVGFALETTAPLERARRKLERKQMDLIVLNDATEPGAGFGVDTNRVTLISRHGVETPLPLLSKQEVGEVILDFVEEMLVG
jgi:phosphopantothenoylcysteine decarboxylase/phosphopantothenate--cysteine ligase